MACYGLLSRPKLSAAARRNPDSTKRFWSSARGRIPASDLSNYSLLVDSFCHPFTRRRYSRYVRGFLRASSTRYIARFALLSLIASRRGVPTLFFYFFLSRHELSVSIAPTPTILYLYFRFTLRLYSATIVPRTHVWSDEEQASRFSNLW